MSQSIRMKGLDNIPKTGYHLMGAYIWDSNNIKDILGKDPKNVGPAGLRDHWGFKR